MNQNNDFNPYSSANTIHETGTETTEAIVIEAEPIEEEKDKKQKINFLDQDITSDLFNGITNDDKGGYSMPNVETGNDEDEDEEETSDEEVNNLLDELSPKDFMDESEFFLDIFDTGVEMVCYAISGEKDKGMFQIEKDKRKKLSKQLSNILHKHRFKMSVEMMFFISACVIYSKPIQQAISMRNSRKQNKAKYNGLVNDENYGNTQQDSKAKQRKNTVKTAS